jgi:hypothetical protein
MILWSYDIPLLQAHPVYGLRVNKARSLKGPLLLEDSVRT